jgi:CubicO group peptidase (beta-lactamase class C family)
MKFRPLRTVAIASLLAFSLCAALVCESRKAAASAQAASDDASVGAAVDVYVNAEIAAEKIPGLALAVVRDGHLIKATGYGFANVELDVRVTPETIFQTGSVGKQFAAVGVMMLVEENKIALDDKLSKYLPNTPAKWRDVTIRHLLTHTSGIADYGGEIDSKPTVIDLRKDYTEDELFKQFTLLPMNFPPGTSWSYSNTGYVLLGFVIRKVTGEFYGDFLQQRIFQPLGMTSTRIISESDIVKNRSAGYELVNGEIKNQKWVAPTLNTTADGALYTNVLDMARWDAALYTDKLLKRSSFDQIWTPVTLKPVKKGGDTSYPYGFGWDITSAGSHKLIEHSGSWQGFTTQISRYADDRLTVIALCNLDSDHAHPDTIAHHVAGLYIPAVMPAPPPTKSAVQ